MSTPLKITHGLLHAIDVEVQLADSFECLGLLASERGADWVTDMEVLPARASASHAEAAPIAVARAAESLRSRGLVPRGLWHSHGHLPVFHSGTDHGTIDRLLPGMAAWNLTRDSAAAI